MIIKAIANLDSDVPQDIRDFAYPHGETAETLDISPGKCYAVFALSMDTQHTSYLVHTDTENAHGLWWMPAELYEVVDSDTPQGWTEEKGSTEGMTIKGFPVLFEGTTEEDIVDGDDEAIEKYLNESESDISFPKQAYIDELNKSFEAELDVLRYNEARRLSDERGYELPDSRNE